MAFRYSKRTVRLNLLATVVQVGLSATLTAGVFAPADAVATNPQRAEGSKLADLRGQHPKVVVRQPKLLQPGQVPDLEMGARGGAGDGGERRRDIAFCSLAMHST